jgi:hypothetical protein
MGKGGHTGSASRSRNHPLLSGSEFIIEDKPQVVQGMLQNWVKIDVSIDPGE